MTDSYWMVKTMEGVSFRVDERTAHRLLDEWERGDRTLEFVDCAGGNCCFIASQFMGMWESTPEIRAADREINEMVDSEGGAFS